MPFLYILILYQILSCFCFCSFPPPQLDRDLLHRKLSAATADRAQTEQLQDQSRAAVADELAATAQALSQARAALDSGRDRERGLYTQLTAAKEDGRAAREQAQRLLAASLRTEVGQRKDGNHEALRALAGELQQAVFARYIITKLHMKIYR